jgi:hypothetical protein
MSTPDEDHRLSSGSGLLCFGDESLDMVRIGNHELWPQSWPRRRSCFVHPTGLHAEYVDNVRISYYPSVKFKSVRRLERKMYEMRWVFIA